MERTVGSFKSFIRTVPPNPSTWSDISPLSPSDQTLPLSSLTPEPKPTDSAVHVTSWRAPTEWNLSSPRQPSTIDPASTTRTYSPLIPEPSPSVCSSRRESRSWPLETRALQSPPLQPIPPNLACIPEPPPPSLTRPPSVQTLSIEETQKSLLSPVRDNSSAPLSSNAEATRLVSHSSLKSGVPTSSTPSADAIYQSSHASRRAKAYASLGIMWPRETRQYSSVAPQFDSIAEVSQLLQEKRLPPLCRASPFMDDECEDEELSDRLQLLSFSQDYHDVLSNQKHEYRAPRRRSSSVSATSSRFFTCGCISFPILLPKSQDLIPQPLSWTRGSSRQTKHKKSNLWTPLGHINQENNRQHVDENVLRRSTERLTSQHRKRIPGMMSQTKGLRASNRRDRSTESENSEGIPHMSRRLGSNSTSQGSRSVLFRLPRGLAVVRLSRATTSHSDATYSYDITQHGDQRQKSSAVSDYPWRRSSFFNSSPPSSPFPYDTPPPLPVSLTGDVKSELVPPLLETGEIWTEEKCSGILPDEEIGNRGLIDRARHVRDAWRRHQREVKHEKIKQSIKVLGLMDSTAAASYTKSWGMRLGDFPSE